MKLKTLLLLFSLTLILTGCNLFSSLTGTDDTQEQGTEPTSTTGTNDTDGGSESLVGSITDLLQRGIPMHCTVTYTEEDSTGTVNTYVANNKFYTEIAAVLNDGTEQTYYALSDGEWSYMWSPEQGQGIKMQFDATQFEEGFDLPDTPGLETEVDQPDYSQDYNYNCTPWIPDNSKFTPPTDITFMDMDSLLNAIPGMAGEGTEGTEGLPGDACAVCSMIEDATAKASCMESLGC